MKISITQREKAQFEKARINHFTRALLALMWHE